MHNSYTFYLQLYSLVTHIARSKHGIQSKNIQMTQHDPMTYALITTTLFSRDFQEATWGYPQSFRMREGESCFYAWCGGQLLYRAYRLYLPQQGESFLVEGE